NMVAKNHDLKFDITKNKLHTLSDQSVKIVSGLQQDVKIRAFVSPMQMSDFTSVFDKYTQHSKHLKVEFVDVDKNPLEVKQLQIRQLGTLIVESATRSARVDDLTGPDDPKIEEKITNALIQVEKGDKKKIYFVNGHGERLINDSSREGYSEIKNLLTTGRFNVEELNLLEKDKIPADAAILIVPGPQKEFIAPEWASINEYLLRGGSVLFMVEPTSSKAVQPFLAKYGVKWEPLRVVVENNRLQQMTGNSPLTPIVAQYDAGHEITREARQMSIFAIATPISKEDKLPEGLTVTSLFSTSASSQASFLKGNKLALGPGDQKGPFTLAVAIVGKATAAPAPAKTEEKKEGEAPPKEAQFRMVVVGDSDFPANGVKGFGINEDLFQNMLSWLAEEEDLISIRPKATDETQFDITEGRMRVITLASVFALPLMMLFSGVLVWYTRRRK
ncbi:GldG family protein, partial [bacterium]|nr:GldG family protein [bacterium]